MAGLNERVSIVTGAARGIGYGTALKLAGLGSKVAIVDLQLDAAEAAAQRLRDLGLRATGHAANVAIPGEIEAAIQQVAGHYGRVDALVNIAGIWSAAPFEELGFQEWRRIFDVNVDGVFRACQCAYRLMMQAGYGRIVNIATGAVATGRPGMAHYVASKAAVIGLTRVIASEGGEHGITANVIAPGLIATEGVMATSDLPEMEDQVVPFQKVKRVGLPADIAEAVAYFVSPETSFVTGQTMFVDGGMVLH